MARMIRVIPSMISGRQLHCNVQNFSRMTVFERFWPSSCMERPASGLRTFSSFVQAKQRFGDNADGAALASAQLESAMETIAGDFGKKFTPVEQTQGNIYAKLEGFNAGGSIKDRAVMKCSLGMFQRGVLKQGDTLCLCTSGNAGRSLLHVQERLAQDGIELNIKIFMPRRYLERVVPGAIANTRGVVTVKGDQEVSLYAIPHPGPMSRFLHGLDGEFMEVQQKMDILAKDLGWVTLDQHFDHNSMLAHESTAKELLQQLPYLTDVVCTTGTGGTAAGLRKYLPPHVNVHSRPARPGDIDGITDVRRYNNFCDTELLEGFEDNYFDKDECVRMQMELREVHGITAGQSSGAAFALAKTVLKQKGPAAHVAFICADGVMMKPELTA